MDTTTHPTTVEQSAPGAALSIERLLHLAGHPSLRRRRVGAARRAHRPRRARRVRADATSSSRRPGRRTPPTSSPRSTSAASSARPTRERSVKQMIGRVAGTIAGWGRERGYFATDDGRRRLRGRADPHPAAPDGGVQLARLVQRRLRGEPAVLGLLHPLGRGHDGVDPRLEHQGGDDLPRRLGLGHQPVEHPRLDGAARQGRHRLRARSRSCAAPTPGPARSSPAARRGARRRWSCSTSTTPTSASSSGARPRRRTRPRRCATPASTCRSTATASRRSSTRTPTTRCASPTSSCSAVENDDEWHLIARTTGEPIGEPIPARELMREIAEAAWRCADPGVQYDTTINRWHTCPNSGRINASNPCSRVHARRRLGLQPRVAEPDEVPPRRRHASTSSRFEHAVDVVLLAQEIIVAPSSYPTEEIGDNARAFRQLGLGYANLGAYLMGDGMPYDSDAGRAHGGGDHRADDRSRLPRVGRGRRRASGPTSATPRTATRTTP